MTMQPCVAGQLTRYTTPWGQSVTVNKEVLERFKAACELANKKSKWKPKRVDSYNCRSIRGSTTYSRHAYGAAWDFFNKPYDQPVDVWGSTNAPPSDFAQCFKQFGFTWGGDWTSRKDYPHIEWSANVVPGGASNIRVAIALEKGASGQAVRMLQKRLIAHGLLMDADGKFGEGTKKAVQSFQRKFGLTPDGVVGPKTRAALKKKPKKEAKPPVLSVDDEGKWVKKAQEALSKNGSKVKVDGDFGDETAEAVKKFKAKKKLKKRPLVGPKTWKALDV